MWHIHQKNLKLSGTESIHSSCYSEITDRSQKMTIFGKFAISPDEGPYRKNWSSQTLHQRSDYYRGNFRWNPSRHVLEKESAKCHLKRHLSPHLGLTILLSLSLDGKNAKINKTDIFDCRLQNRFLAHAYFEVLRSPVDEK